MINTTKLIQICGYSNSGKTTLVNKIVSKFAQENKRVLTIKHHGHGTKPTVVENKDSSSHIINGAIGSLVEGEGRILLQLEDGVKTLEQQIKMATFFNPDLILIEGHKRERYPKVLIIRKKEELGLVQNLTNIQLVIVWEEYFKDLINEKIKVLSIKQEEELINEIESIIHLNEVNNQ